jgi:hypothetical protein
MKLVLFFVYESNKIRSYTPLPLQEPKVWNEEQTCEKNRVGKNRLLLVVGVSKRNADYIACCDSGGKGKLASLYLDFGDVRGEDFKAWWTFKINGEDRGAYLSPSQASNLR